MIEHQAERNHVKAASEKSFRIVMGIAFSVLAGVFWYKDSDSQWFPIFLGIAGLFFVLGLFWTTPLKPLNFVWLKFGELLHRIISPIVMGLMYFLVFTPIGLIMRLFGKDFLNQRLSPDVDSYWIDTTNREENSSMTQQF